MNIVLSVLERYCEKNGFAAHSEIDITSNDAFIRFVAGKYEQQSSTAVYLSFADLYDILTLNNIIGEDSKVRALLDAKEVNMDKRIELNIYDTLSKYIIQMLNGALAEI